MKIGGQMRKTETQNAKKRKIEFTENVENRKIIGKMKKKIEKHILCAKT